MIENIPSIVLVTSVEIIKTYYSDVLQFFNNINIRKKDLIIFAPKPISDYSDIKKISADEVMIFYQKDFLPLNIMIKPDCFRIINKRKYSTLVHFNQNNFIRNTHLIAKSIPSGIKITNILKYSKVYSVVIQADNYLLRVLDYLGKMIV